jgi:hypothetical protein
MFKSNPTKLMQSYFLFLGTNRKLPITKKEENNNQTRDQGSTPKGAWGSFFLFNLFTKYCRTNVSAGLPKAPQKNKIKLSWGPVPHASAHN